MTLLKIKKNFRMNKINIIWNILIVMLIILLLLCFFDSLSHINLCDSGSMDGPYETTNNDNHDNNNVTYTNLTRWQLKDRFRRRIYWYVTVKKSGRYNTYDEYKITWNPEVNVWKDLKSFIKNDFNNTRQEITETRNEAKIDSARRMSDIKRARELQNEARYNRRLEIFKIYASRKKK